MVIERLGEMQDACQHLFENFDLKGSAYAEATAGQVTQSGSSAAEV